MLQSRGDLQATAHDALAPLFIDDHISVKDRLGVYHNNIIGSMVEVLMENFPITTALVGEDFFKTMARHFCFDTPPTTPVMHHFGAGFDAFIRDYAPAQKLPYIADMASFDYAMNAAYYAANDTPLTPQSLGAIPPDALADTLLPLRAAATLLQSPYPLADIRAFCLNNSDSDNAPQPDLTPRAYAYLISRARNNVHIAPLTADEHHMLMHLQNRAPLGDAVSTTLETYPQFDIAAFLQKHVQLETFTEI